MFPDEGKCWCCRERREGVRVVGLGEAAGSLAEARILSWCDQWSATQQEPARLHLVPTDGVVVVLDGSDRHRRPDRTALSSHLDGTDQFHGTDPVDGTDRLARIGRLRAALHECGFPEHVVSHLVALVPVLGGGVAGTGPAAGAFRVAPSADEDAAPDDDAAPEADVTPDDGPLADQVRSTRTDSLVEQDAGRGDDSSADDESNADLEPSPALASGAWWLSGQATSRATDEELVEAVDAALVLSRWSDSLLVGVVADLAAATGEKLLAKRAVADPSELSDTGRETWRKKTKSAMAHELQILTGWGIQDCHDRVAFATGPRVATTTPWRAMASGEVQWNQVRAWWSTCRQMPVEVAVQVAKATFGEESERAASARDGGVDPDDMARQGWGETKDVLDRLVAALAGQDPAKAKADREAAVSRRDARAQVEDDGTGCLTITGRTTSIVAAIQRVDRAARALRAAGDPRSLSQLRADLALSLLIHGRTGGGPEPKDAPESSTAGADQVLDDESRPAQDTSQGDSPGYPPGAAIPGSGQAEVSPSPGSGPGSGQAQGPPSPGSAAPGDVLGGLDDVSARILAGTPKVNLDVIVPLDVLVNPHSAGVGMIPGYGYLTGEAVRELAARAGGVMHRLVTDPLDGHLVERTATTYRPDAQMRAFTEAADRHCRAPGCRVPAENCDFDHVHAHSEGGVTSASNGMSGHRPHHELKTRDVWQAQIDRDRRVTWTTLFGACYTTRTFDYRTLTRPAKDQIGTGRTSTGPGQETAVLEEARERFEHAADGDADLQDRLIYAALAHRDRSEPLAAEDDYFDPEDRSCGPAWVHHNAPIQLRHRTRNGQRSNGPPPDQPTPEEILGLSAPSEVARPGDDGRDEATPGTELPPPF